MNSIFFTIILVAVLISNIINIDALKTTTSSLLINCGLLKPTQSLDGLVWQSDDDPSFAPPNLNDVSDVVQNDNLTSEVPYQVGRVFWSNITYTFSITPGPIFLRLYFFPNVSYNNTLPHQFSTSVFANNFTLFKYFNPFLNSPIDNFYEFHLILRNEENNLNLTFSPRPTTAASSNISYGYINGIEIESVPQGLYINQTNLNYRFLDPRKGYILDINAATFQMAFRLNVGGEHVGSVNDNPGGMRRTWEADDEYLVGPHGVRYQPSPEIEDNIVVNYTKKTPPYVAPKIVYDTLRIMGDDPAAINLGWSLTWVFEVDPGFDYVVRLHMREMDLNVTGIGQRSMCVYIGGYVADPGIDIWAEAGGFGVPIYKDYLTTIPGTSKGSKVPLSLALHPNLAYITDVMLNGVEILKLSNSDRNLAIPNQRISSNPTPTNQSSTRNTIPAIVGGVIGCVLIIIVLLLSLLRRRLQPLLMKPTRANLHSRPSLPLDLCRRFSLSQIKVATREFDPKSVIGRGGFGKVYKGSIDNGATSVAIKRLNSTSNQGEHEFLTEIKMLSRLRHKHLVSLIGYCDDKGEMILVYEYMPHGTLRDHLKYRGANQNDKNNNQLLLSWKQRLTICLGAARGLEYLHAGTQQLIIHRDVKSTNILLDDNWTAKVSDFGLSKVGPASDTGVGHVSTTVKGSFGYLDPEYYQRGQLTEKLDVYSFGVMLIEVLCAQPAVGLNLPKVRACCRKGTLDTIVDPTLTGQITPECLSKYGEIAEMCVRENREERPSMRGVVWSLEFMLAHQQTAENTSDNASPMVEITIRSNAGYDYEDGESTLFESRVDEVGAQGSSTIDNTHMDVKSSSVFSEMFDLQAR